MAAYTVLMANQTIAGASTLVIIRAAAAAGDPGVVPAHRCGRGAARRPTRPPSSWAWRSARR